jgi:tRNA(Ile)-lysidine synthase
MPKLKRFRDTLLDRLDPELLLLPRATPALVGVSGGLDSSCLLHLLLHAGFSQLTACHVDHALRPCSAQDALFVQTLCAQLSVPLLSTRSDVSDLARHHRISLETAGRRARHTFFRQCASQTGTAVVLLAHHADDQVETLLARLFRGSGTRGLAGMRATQNLWDPAIPLQIRRPMLRIWRNELEQLASEEKIPFREDPTNTDPKPTRNRIRLQVLPDLERIFGPALRSRLLQTTSLLRAEDDLLESLLPEATAELSVRTLQTLPLAVQRRTLHRWLTEQVLGEIGFGCVESVRTLLHSKCAKVNLPAGHHARRTSGKLWIQKPALSSPSGLHASANE